MSDSKIMSDSHWLGRIRDLMQQVGMPDSQPLYLAFTQLMFEMQREALAAAPRAAQEPKSIAGDRKFTTLLANYLDAVEDMAGKPDYFNHCAQARKAMTDYIDGFLAGK